MDSCTRVKWLFKCDMTPYMWHDWFVRGELIEAGGWDTVCRNSFVCVKWLFLYDMTLGWHDWFIFDESIEAGEWDKGSSDSWTHAQVWDVFLNVTWLLICDMTDLYVTSRSRLVEGIRCVMTRSYVWLVHMCDSFICVNWLLPVTFYVT